MKVLAILMCAFALSSATIIPSTYLGGYGYALAATPAVSYAPLPYAVAAPVVAPLAAHATAGYVRYETPAFAYSYAHPVGYLKK
ncbi:hypothetical protein CDAR_222721 [Caerostris darwini]|uniref:Uncharacterized protein n=1 Tax=Caerostris darwini TaxID=1538125 RepID=A0AAV4NFY3_9ARAC|nr:hypothetical protein CDAR_222721 [Caerostris darwini]